jgi:uncharacterized membrane protein YeiH
LDALPVGLYTTIGMTRALSIGLPLLPAMFVGVTADVGGSALRDMLLAQPVAMLKVGTLYAVAAIAVLWSPPPCECARCGSACHCPSNARGC